MKKAKLLSGVLATVGILMISIALIIQSENTLDTDNQKVTYHEIDIKSVAASTNMLIQKDEDAVADTLKLKEVKMETIPASIIVPPRVEVYEGMTLEEVAAKIDRNLGGGYMAGKGMLIAKTSLDYGVDPFIAAAIILHETGCSANCSRLVITCNNVGGQKGSPGCNGGAYKVFASLDEGIIGFVQNLHRNYYAYGLTT
ncbi:MAG: glucosaminidase domain-containing protein, partial [Bacilli bacterium]|nr:glucosaminidase domain-containing protein [Bacilli bacterium]